MSMSPETKARLQELAAEKRKKNPKPKDYTVDHWLVAADAVEEDGSLERLRELPHEESRPRNPVFGKLRAKRIYCWAYLKYVPIEVVNALAQRIPNSRSCPIQAGPTTRWVVLFERRFLEAILNWLHLDKSKYMRGYALKDNSTPF